MTNTDLNARVSFLQNLQGLDLDNLDAGLAAMSVDAANLFPMISDDVENDGSAAGAAYRARLLADSIYRVSDNDGVPMLTLEQPILITLDGRIVDGRNRIAAILRNAGLPAFNYTGDFDEVNARFTQAIMEKPAAMDVIKQAAGQVDAAWNDADLLFVHTDVSEGSDASWFNTIMNRNMARRDLTTSQRGCVAANVSLSGYKKMAGLKGKPTDEAIAESFGIGHKTMKRAKALKKADKALFQHVLEGRCTLGKAEQLVKQQEALAAGGDEPTPVKTKAPKADITNTIEYGVSAVEKGISNPRNSTEAVIQAILDGVLVRGGTGGDEFENLEIALNRYLQAK